MSQERTNHMSERIINLFVPGRLCLFGEHSDWAGMYRTVNSSLEKGTAIVSGTEQGIYATARKADKCKREIWDGGLCAGRRVLRYRFARFVSLHITQLQRGGLRNVIYNGSCI